MRLRDRWSCCVVALVLVGCGSAAMNDFDEDLGVSGGSGGDAGGVVDLAMCPESCTVGATRCVVAATQDTCQLGADGCPTWVTSACGSGLLCLKEACEEALPCFCPAGFACNPQSVCTGGNAGTLPGEAQTVAVSGKITLAGQLPIRTSACAQLPTLLQATVHFVDHARGAMFDVPVPCSAADVSFSTKIYRGTYDVSVIGTASNNLPLGTTPVTSGLVVGGAVTNLVLDVRTFKLSGTITVDGAPPSTAAACAGTPTATKATVRVRDSLVPGAVDRAVDIPCSASTFAWALDVPTGTYDITVAADASLTNLPTRYVYKQKLPIAADVPNQNIDIKLVSLSGTVLHNGVVPPLAASCSGAPTKTQATVHFVEAITHTQTDFLVPCSSASLAWSGKVSPGTYQVSVQGSANDSTLAPDRVVVIPALVVSLPLSNQVLDVRDFTVSGKVTRNGVTPTVKPTCASAGSSEVMYYVQFSDLERGYVRILTLPCTSTDFSYSTTLNPGTYEIQVYGNSMYTDLPANGLYLHGVVLDAAATKNFDLAAVPITVNVTLNGQPPMDKPSTDCAMYPGEPKAELALRGSGSQRGRFALTCATSGYTFTGDIPPGSYRATVTGHGEFTTLPDQAFVSSTQLSFGASPTPQTIDVKTTVVAGKITLDGMVPTTDPSCASFPTAPKASVLLEDVDSYNSYEFVVPCSSTDFSWSGTLFAGTYAMRVVGKPGRSNLPPTAFLVSPRIALP